MTIAPSDCPATWSDVFTQRALDSAQTEAFSEPGWFLTYAELDRLSNQIAPAIVAATGAGAGTIGYVGRPSVDYFLQVAAAARANVPSVAFNWRLSSEELAAALLDANVRALLVQQEHLDLVNEACAKASIHPEIILSGPGAQEKWAQGRERAQSWKPPQANDVLMLVYTSGTTGAQKGVMLSHGNVMSTAREFARVVGMDDKPRALAQSPVFHVSGSTYGLLAALSGGTTFLSSEVTPNGIARLVKELELTVVVMMSSVLESVLEPGIDVEALSQLKVIIYGGGPIRLDALKRLQSVLGCGLAQIYGLSEVVGSVSILAPADHDAARPHLLASAGKVLPHVEVLIEDLQTGQRSDSGIGEILVRGSGVMLGYWNKPRETAETIDADGWLRTGDIGELLDGSLYIRDRLKDMIVSGGENIYSGEVERALLRHPNVREAAVVGVPDRKWGEAPFAFVVTDAAVAAEELRGHCKALLAGYKCPGSFVSVDALPRNLNGKILKAQLRREAVARLGG